jgi:hypothetical protein
MAKISPDKKGADRLFEKWGSSLSDRPKDKDNIYNNFNDLFFEMSRNFISHDLAYEYIKPAVTKHLPDKYIVSRTYKSSIANKSQSESEFFEGWKNLILSKATQAFYDVYPLEASENASEAEKIQLPKGMSKKEYVLQRQHAKSFPLLDLSVIEDLYKQVQGEQSVSFDDILGDLNGQDSTRQDK